MRSVVKTEMNDEIDKMCKNNTCDTILHHMLEFF